MHSPGTQVQEPAQELQGLQAMCLTQQELPGKEGGRDRGREAGRGGGREGGREAGRKGGWEGEN